MDYNNMSEIWERKGCHLSVEEEIKKKFKKIGEDYYGVIKDSTLILIKIDYDDSLKRTIIRTETTPKTSLPKGLVELLEKNNFERISF